MPVGSAPVGYRVYPKSGYMCDSGAAHLLQNCESAWGQGVGRAIWCGSPGNGVSQSVKWLNPPVFSALGCLSAEPWCRAAQDENEEMGRELAEGKVHAIERQAALAKAFAEETRGLLQEGEDHLHSLDAENEELQVHPTPYTLCWLLSPTLMVEGR